VDVYEADVNLVDEYKREEEIHMTNPELADLVGTQNEASPELVNHDHTLIETILVGPLEKDIQKEPNPNVENLLDETLEETQVIQPIKDMISIVRYPQAEVTPLTPIEDLFPEIIDPFFHHQPH